MVSPLVLQDPSLLGAGISQAGGALAQALGQRFQMQAQNRKNQQLSDIIDNMDVSAPGAKETFLQQVLAANIPVETAVQALSFIQPDPVEAFLKGREAQLTAQSETFRRPVESAEFAQLSETDLVRAATSKDPRVRELGRTGLELRKIDAQEQQAKERRFEKEREFHTKETDKFVDEINAERKAVAQKKFSLDMARQAIETGEIGAFSLANVGKRFNIPELQTASGQQLVTAGKEHIISNLGRLSARAQNQWIERQINSMFPEIGKSEAANLAGLIMLEAENEIASARIRVADEIAAEDEAETQVGDRAGFIKRGAQRRLDERVLPEEDAIMRKTSLRLRRNFENEKGDEWMLKNANKKVPQGTMLTRRATQALFKNYADKNNVTLEQLTAEDRATILTNAKKLGYTIPTQEERTLWDPRS